MATANGSAGEMPAIDDGPLMAMNRQARRMNEQQAEGKPTTGRWNCFPITVTAVAVVAVLVKAVR